MSLSLSPPPSGSAEPANTPGLLGTAPSSPNSSTGSFASAMSSQTQIPNVVASDGSPVVDSASPAGASEAVSASTAVNANLTSSPVEYTRFFMPEDMIVFQVANTLYRVPAFPFSRYSKHFATLLEGNKGSTRVDPILIQDDGVENADFERLLSFMFPADMCKSGASTLEEWSSILYLSDKWKFAALRDLAAKNVLPLASSVDQIVLGRKYGFGNWLLDAFTSVCQRKEPLAYEEASRMNLADAVRISQLREKIGLDPALKAPAKLRDLVAKTFGLQMPVPIKGPRGPVVNLPKTPPAPSIFQSAPVNPSQPISPFNFSAMQAVPTPTTATAFSITDPLVPQDFNSVVTNRFLPVHPSIPKVAALILGSRTTPLKTDAIVKLVRESDKLPVTLDRVFALIVQAGIQSVSESPGPKDSEPQYATLCYEILENLRTQQFSFSNLQGGTSTHTIQFSTARQSLNDYCRFLLSKWDEPIPGNANSLVQREKMLTFITHLHRRRLLDDGVVQAYCQTLVQLPMKPTVNDIKKLSVRLTRHGEMLDSPVTCHLVDPVFAQLAFLKFAWEFQEVALLIMLMEDLRKPK